MYSFLSLMQIRKHGLPLHQQWVVVAALLAQGSHARPAQPLLTVYLCRLRVNCVHINIITLLRSHGRSID